MPMKGTTPAFEPTRTGLTKDSLQRAVLDNLTFVQAIPTGYAIRYDWYMALAFSVRDRLLGLLDLA